MPVSALSRAAGWLLPFGLLISAVVAVPLHLFDPQGMPRYRALRAEIDVLETQNRSYRDEVRQLAAQVRALRTDPEALERVARDELGMIREDELVFQFER